MRQAAELGRVTGNIGEAVLDFAKARLAGDPIFHADDLRQSVESAGLIVAPNSPYRIMYNLARQGKLKYTVVSRSGSTYRIEEVAA
jgi:hypothetical protein